MHPLESVAWQMEWAAGNVAHNLDFIPDDKLDWQPAPSAPSALEMIQHILDVLNRMTPLMQSGAMGDVKAEKPANREIAKAQLVEAAHKYSATLRSLDAESLDEIVTLPMVELPLRVVAMMPVIDMIHHHGQIAYIQMLLGDVENHRDWSLLPNWKTSN